MKKTITFIFLSLLLCGFAAAQRLTEFDKAREIKLLEINQGNLKKDNFLMDDLDRIIYDTRPANVTNLILSFPEIVANCSSLANACIDGIKAIAIFAVAADPEGDVITFSFKVSGGKITDNGKTEEYGSRKFRNGKKITWSSFYYGRKVIWDLSNVKPGTYTITVAVDDGCGFCGKPMTKTVVVKECLDCPKSNNKISK